jgi:hypothetical protein
MKFRTLALAVMVLGLGLATTLAADVTGKWVSEMQGKGGEPMQIVYNFKAEGSNLTGTISSPMGGENPISEGKIDGDNISFVMKMEMMGNEMTMKYKGKIVGEEIKLTLEMEGGMGGPGGGPGGKPMEFTLKRAE